MPYHHHDASYEFGSGQLRPEQRVVVGTRPGSKEPRRIAAYMGMSDQQPERLIDHRLWDDGEYLPTFATREGLTRPELAGYAPNYVGPDGERVWGQGLKGRTVYIVHTLSTRFDTQALDTMVKDIAWNAKYNGAANVVLLAYTFPHSAQERGVHQHDHPRMQGDEALAKFDGQAPLVQHHLMQYAVAGVDAIVTLHNHCPDDIGRLCDEVNEELRPQQEASKARNSTFRYRVRFHDVDLAPMVGMFVALNGSRYLQFDVSNGGRNVLFLGPDAGIADFMRRVRRYSGLEHSALAVMRKKRGANGVDLQQLELDSVEGLDPERGIEGMYVLVADDMIRSGATMANNVRVLRGENFQGLIRDPRIHGTPKRVAVYATRTNLAGNAPKVLASPAIDDILLTNADPRGIKDLSVIDHKTLVLWVNHILAEAALALERGEDPNAVLTAERIRSMRLLHIDVPHGHYLRIGAHSAGPL